MINPPPEIGMDDMHIGSIGIWDSMELTHPINLRIFLLNCVNSIF